MNLFVQATPTPDEATVPAALQRLAPFYAEFGLVPERPAQWCEDFGAQFDALVAARPAVASFTFGSLSAAQVARLQAAGSTVIGTATTVAEARAWAAVGADAVCASVAWNRAGTGAPSCRPATTHRPWAAVGGRLRGQHAGHADPGAAMRTRCHPRPSSRRAASWTGVALRACRPRRPGADGHGVPDLPRVGHSPRLPPGADAGRAHGHPHHAHLPPPGAGHRQHHDGCPAGRRAQRAALPCAERADGRAGRRAAAQAGRPTICRCGRARVWPRCGPRSRPSWWRCWRRSCRRPAPEGCYIFNSCLRLSIARKRPF